MPQRPQRFADREDVEKQLEKWDDEVLKCRTYGHQWLPQRAVLNRKGFWSINELCGRCESSRHYEMDTSGEMFGHPQIDYVDGYLSSGLGRIAGSARNAVRLAAVTRTFPIKRLSARESLKEQPHTRAARERFSDAVVQTAAQQKKAAS